MLKFPISSFLSFTVDALQWQHTAFTDRKSWGISWVLDSIQPEHEWQNLNFIDWVFRIDKSIPVCLDAL